MLVLSLQENEIETAQLHLNGKRFDNLQNLGPTVIDITLRFAPDRKKVENFIRDVYRQSYDAHITVTYPVLMSVRNERGDILAAAGFRPAWQENLFLEQYTRRPIEQALSQYYDCHVPRREIVEIGNLASAGQGASLFLFAALSSYLESRGVSYVTLTGTATLYGRLRKLGLSPHILCDADPAMLISEDPQNWGSYYETQPHVLTGSLHDGVRHLQQTLGVIYEDNRSVLLPRLHYRAS